MKTIVVTGGGRAYYGRPAINGIVFYTLTLAQTSDWIGSIDGLKLPHSELSGFHWVAGRLFVVIFDVIQHFSLGDRALEIL